MTTTIPKPSERCHKLFELLLKGADICGANVLKEDYRMNWITWSLIALINAYYAFTIYTIYEGVVIRSDYSVILQSMCLAGAAIQGYTKLLSAIFHAKKLRFLRAEVEAVYEQYERKHEYYQNHLMRSLGLIKRIIMTLFLIYFITSLGLISVPLYYRLILKEQIFVMQYIIPGVDPTTHWGYITHQIVHVSCICFGALGNFASDTLFFVLVSNIPLMKNILKCKFDDLDEILRMHPRDVAKSKPLLKDIFEWHQRYIIFSETAKTSFFWVIFVQIGTATNSIICIIVCLFLGVWPAGPLYLVYSFVILYIYCGLGNLVDIANENITSFIYDSLWYEMSVPEQKMLMMMLRESQEATSMSIGGVSPLTLSTALQLTKTIYTVAMLLNEFLN